MKRGSSNDRKLARLCAAVVLAAAVQACETQVGGLPTINRVEPSIAYNREDTEITVSGERFYLDAPVDHDKTGEIEANAIFVIHIGSTPLADVRWLDVNTLNAVVPAGIGAGQYDLTVTTPSGDSASLSDAFTVRAVPAVSLSSIAPVIGVNDGPTSVTLRGAGFEEGASVLVGDTSVPIASLSTDTITVTVPAGLEPARYDVSIQGADARVTTLPSAFTVVLPAALDVTLDALPTTLSVGDAIVLHLIVSNEGGSAALNVAPALPTWTGTGYVNVDAGPTPLTAIIPVAGQVQFEWQLTATTAGDVTFSSSASGTNEHSERPVTSLLATSTAVAIELPQTLNVSIAVTPSVVSVSQPITVKMTVQNTAIAVASNVLPMALQPDNAALATLSLAPTGTQEVVPGGQADFLWTYTAAQAGTVTFSGESQGNDTSIGSIVVSNLATSNLVTVLVPATPQIISMSLAPVMASAGQQITATYLVQNIGEADAQNVAPVAPVALGGSVVPVGDPAPATATIPAAGQQSFAWTFSTTSPGSLSLSGTVQGTDALSGLLVTSPPLTSNSITVLAPAQLTATVTAGPAVLTEGQTLSVTMQVSNTGQVDAQNVVPSALTLTGTGNATLLSGPVPTSLAFLAPGATHSFSWTYSTATGNAGSLTFTGSAQGQDALSNSSVGSAPSSAPAVIIQVPPSLQLAVNAPAGVAQGQSGVLVRVTVTNSGQADAAIALPTDATIQIVPGNTSYAITRTDSVGIIPGNQNRTLTFSVDVGPGAPLGAATIDAEVIAADANSGSGVSVFLSDPSTTTDTWGVAGGGTPASLSITLDIASPSGALDGIVSTGQSLTLTALVENNGGCAIDGTGQITFDLRTSGATTGEVLTRTLNVGTPETLGLVASVAPTAASTIEVSISSAPSDICSSAPASIAVSTDSVIVQTVTGASLAISASITAPTGAADGTVSTAQPFDLTVSIANAGTAAVIGPAELTVGVGSTGVSLVTPASLTQSFVPGAPVVFTFQAPSVATAFDQLTSTISTVPIDENTSLAVTVSQGSDATSLTTQAAASLSITSLSATPSPVEAGGSLTVTMRVQNSGGARALSVAPSALTTGGTVPVILITGPTPVAASIAGGGLLDFVWTYIVSDQTGSTDFNGSASGTDENSSATIASAQRASPVVKVVATCGNGLAQANEVCDAADLRAETCLSQGFLRSTGGGLACTGTCTAFVTTQCTGGPIDSEAQINAAIAEAYARSGHEVISIQSGSYVLNSNLILDECGGGTCSGGKPYGLTLQVLSGDVTLDGSAVTQPIFDVTTGNNVFLNLAVIEAGVAFDLQQAGADAGGNIISHVTMQNASILPATFVLVGSDNNLVEANRFMNNSGMLAGNAIGINGENTVVSMNTIYGPFNAAIRTDSITGAGGAITFLDHNSIMLTDQLGSVGVQFVSSSGLCYRNNIIYGDSTSTGMDLNAVVLATAAACGGTASQNNVNINHAMECVDAAATECPTYCTGGGGLCDLSTDPGFLDDELCLNPGTNPLIDAGIDLGYDMWDASPSDFNGIAPEVGAREHGVVRSYGGTAVSCP